MSAIPSAINLLPASRLAARRRRSRLRWWSVAVILYGAVLAMGCIVISGFDGGSRSLRTEIAEKQAKIDIRQSEVGAARVELAAVQRSIEASNAVGNHPDWSLLLQLLAHARGDSVVLARCELKPRIAPPVDPKSKPGSVQPDPGFVLSLDAVATSQGAASQYVLDLEALKIFDSVSLVETRPHSTVRPLNPGIALTFFRVSCNLSSKPAAAGGAP